MPNILFFFFSFAGALPSISDQELRQLASDLGVEWESLATHLDFQQAHIQKFKLNNMNNIEGAIFDMLVSWRDSHASASEKMISTLCCALRKVERADLADKISGVMEKFNVGKNGNLSCYGILIGKFCFIFQRWIPFFLKY